MTNRPFESVLKPPRLQPGARIAVIAPAGPVTGERLTRLERGIDYLRRRGFQVIEGRSLRRQTGYTAGSDDERLADLNNMLHNAQVDAIFCARGGYGLSRILDKIDYRAVRRRPKILVGYSDVTALQMALFRRTGLVTFAGPMAAADLGTQMPETTESSLWQMLTGAVAHPVVDELKIVAPGIAEGRLLGGCLSVLVTLLGTRFMPNLDGAVLVAEDIGEPLYKIDRYFCQLKNAGLLRRLKGVILGQFTGLKDSPGDLHAVVAGFFQGDVPIVAGLPFGHEPLKMTIPYGVRVRLDADAGALHFLEAGVL